MPTKAKRKVVAPKPSKKPASSSKPKPRVKVSQRVVVKVVNGGAGGGGGGGSFHTTHLIDPHQALVSYQHHAPHDYSAHQPAPPPAMQVTTLATPAPPPRMQDEVKAILPPAPREQVTPHTDRDYDAFVKAKRKVQEIQSRGPPRTLRYSMSVTPVAPARALVPIPSGIKHSVTSAMPEAPVVSLAQRATPEVRARPPTFNADAATRAELKARAERLGTPIGDKMSSDRARRKFKAMEIAKLQ